MSHCTWPVGLPSFPQGPFKSGSRYLNIQKDISLIHFHKLLLPKGDSFPGIQHFHLVVNHYMYFPVLREEPSPQKMTLTILIYDQEICTGVSTNQHFPPPKQYHCHHHVKEITTKLLGLWDHNQETTYKVGYPKGGKIIQN